MPLLKATYEQRKAQGLCVRCGEQPAIPNQNLCKSCKELRPYNQRKAQGLCPRCGKTPQAGRKLCSECLRKAKEVQQWYKNHGICVRCHQSEALEGMTLCYDCDLKNIARCRTYASHLTPEQKEKRKSYQKAWRAARIDAGLCIACGNPLVDTRYQKCGGCLAYDRNLKREQSKANNYARLGKCRRCGSDPVDGYKFCQRHLEEARQLAERNFRPFGKPVADISYFRQINNALFTKRKPAVLDGGQFLLGGNQNGSGESNGDPANCEV